MREIGLPSGHITFVDDEDYDWLSVYNWRVLKRPHTKYVLRNFRKSSGEWSGKYMHREIMDMHYGPLDKKSDIDHIDNNGLNNVKSNLRICNRSQNLWNMRDILDGTSRYKGVCWDKKRCKWKAQIAIHGERKQLGRFDNEVDAALAYDKFASENFGEFAKTNFPIVVTNDSSGK